MTSAHYTYIIYIIIRQRFTNHAYSSLFHPSMMRYNYLLKLWLLEFLSIRLEGNIFGSIIDSLCQSVHMHCQATFSSASLNAAFQSMSTSFIYYTIYIDFIIQCFLVEISYFIIVFQSFNINICFLFRFGFFFKFRLILNDLTENTKK